MSKHKDIHGQLAASMPSIITTANETHTMDAADAADDKRCYTSRNPTSPVTLLLGHTPMLSQVIISPHISGDHCLAHAVQVASDM